MPVKGVVSDRRMGMRGTAPEALFPSAELHRICQWHVSAAHDRNCQCTHAHSRCKAQVQQPNSQFVQSCARQLCVGTPCGMRKRK